MVQTKHFCCFLWTIIRNAAVLLHFCPLDLIFFVYFAADCEIIAIFMADKGMKWAFWPMET